jgi:hypothetical protein
MSSNKYFDRKHSFRKDTTKAVLVENWEKEYNQDSISSPNPNKRHVRFEEDSTPSAPTPNPFLIDYNAKKAEGNLEGAITMQMEHLAGYYEKPVLRIMANPADVYRLHPYSQEALLKARKTLLETYPFRTRLIVQVHLSLAGELTKRETAERKQKTLQDQVEREQKTLQHRVGLFVDEILPQASLLSSMNRFLIGLILDKEAPTLLSLHLKDNDKENTKEVLLDAINTGNPDAPNKFLAFLTMMRANIVVKGLPEDNQVRQMLENACRKCETKDEHSLKRLGEDSKEKETSFVAKYIHARQHERQALCREN